MDKATHRRDINNIALLTGNHGFAHELATMEIALEVDVKVFVPDFFRMVDERAAKL